MGVWEELQARKLVNNVTNKDKLLEFLQTSEGIYAGFDPTASSLHLGNYTLLRVLQIFKDAGYNTFALIGGATGLIGDPSGKNAERPLLEAPEVAKNVAAISEQIKRLTKSKIINNIDHYKDFSVIDFLREVGKSFNVNYLLEKDIIKNRLETGISYTEMSYSLLQAYDFYTLYKKHKILCQVGGSDQWGNITAGIEYIRKRIGDNNIAVGLTINLLTKSDGTKFGKSEQGAIYLDPKLTSPYQMYQFLINQPDQEIHKLLLALSSYSLPEIEDIICDHNQKPKERIGQKMLAKDLITNIHGAPAFHQCEAIATAFFKSDLSSLSPELLKMALTGMPKYEVNETKIGILDLLVASKLCASKSQARQLIASKGCYWNNKLVLDTNEVITKTNRHNYLRKGKKDYMLIVWK